MKRTLKYFLIGYVVVLLLHSISSIQHLSARGSARLTGEELWAANCYRCHNARQAQEFSDENWELIVDHMRVVAGLTGNEAKRILEYLQENN